jgi:dipeptidyl aminopeptidase/acylaminoacyl peptidase
MSKTKVIAAALCCAAGSVFAHASPVTLIERAPSLSDLVEMKTIDSLSLSPDGKRVAFRVISPSLTKNVVTVRWFWREIDGSSGKTVPLGRPSEPLRMPLFDSIIDGQIQWAEDGSALYVQTLRNGQVTVNRIAPRSVDQVVAADPADIEAFSVKPGERLIVISTRATRRDIDNAQAAERKKGIRVDRSVSLEGSRLTQNFAIGNRWSTVRYVDKGNLAREAFSGPLREKTIALAETLRSRRPAAAPEREPHDVVLSASAKDAGTSSIPIDGGRSAIRLKQVASPTPFLYEPIYQIVATDKSGVISRRCEADFCLTHAAAIRSVSWNDRAREVVVASEPNYSARTTLYGWSPESGKTRIIRLDDGSLDGGSTYSNRPCVSQSGNLICVMSTPTTPQRLVRVNASTGETSILFDPNFSLNRRRYNPTLFLFWNDENGNTSTGVLVTPLGKIGPVPLVITSYRCRGFLRGGYTSLAPEQLLAERGIAALCVNHNNAIGMAAGPDGKLGTLALHIGAITAYRAIIDQLAVEGLIDPKRVGMAGHSFTSMVGTYALSHTDMFKTVVIGGGITIDPASLMFINASRDGWSNSLLEVLGLPHPLDDTEERWKAVSPALNAGKIGGSLMIQTPEVEYLGALQLFAAMQHANRASEMYIYPNEGHVFTREPQHHFFRMRRSVDWFDFWLQDHTSSKYMDAAEVARWRKLKAEQKIVKPARQN